MKLQLSYPPLTADFKIRHGHKLFFLGSCFAENIAHFFSRHKFASLQNPHGILYNPHSMANCLDTIATQQLPDSDDFFMQDGIYASWHYHSNLADTTAEAFIQKVTTLNATAKSFLLQTDVAFITLGTAWVYRHKKKNIIVANNLKAPGHFFEKELLDINSITEEIARITRALRTLNDQMRIVLTISPVRHIRQGLVANNRSKARLIEAIHTACEQDASLLYLPSYEIIMDVLRDYRFFAADLTHPNELASNVIWEYIRQEFIHEADTELLDELFTIHLAMQHKLCQPNSEAAIKFKKEQLAKIQRLASRHTYIDFSSELAHFSV